MVDGPTFSRSWLSLKLGRAEGDSIFARKKQNISQEHAEYWTRRRQNIGKVDFRLLEKSPSKYSTEELQNIKMGKQVLEQKWGESRQNVLQEKSRILDNTSEYWTGAQQNIGQKDGRLFDLRTAE